MKETLIRNAGAPLCRYKFWRAWSKSSSADARSSCELRSLAGMLTISSGESGTGATVVAAVSFAAWQSALGAQMSARAAKIIAIMGMLQSREEKRGVQNRELGRRVIAPPHTKIVPFGTTGLPKY